MSRDDVPNVDLIVDCGANAGFASAFLLSRFPDASLYAIEPDPGNRALERNLAPCGSRARVGEPACGRTTRDPYRGTSVPWRWRMGATGARVQGTVSPRTSRRSTSRRCWSEPDAIASSILKMTSRARRPSCCRRLTFPSGWPRWTARDRAARRHAVRERDSGLPPGHRRPGIRRHPIPRTDRLPPVRGQSRFESFVAAGGSGSGQVQRPALYRPSIY